MYIKIYFKGQSYTVIITPRLCSSNIKSTDVYIYYYNVDFQIQGRSLELKYEIIFERKDVAILDEEMNVVGKKLDIYKTRKILTNIYSLAKNNENDFFFDIISHSACLLDVFAGHNSFEELVPDFNPVEVNANSFFFIKDKNLTSNIDLKYIISESIKEEGLIYCPYIYAPKDSINFKIRNPAFTGSVSECENILFNPQNLKDFRQTVIEKIRRKEIKESKTANDDYFYRGGWREDYRHHMGQEPHDF